MWHTSLTETLTNRRRTLQTFFSLGALVAGGGLGLSACRGENGNVVGVAGGPQQRGTGLPTRQAFNFADPAESLQAFIKLTGDLDPAVQTIGWFDGYIFAVLGPDRPLQRILGVEGFGVLRVAKQADGKYRLFNRELAYYKDPLTGEFLDVWTNPFTNEQVEVDPVHNRVINAEIAPVMKVELDGAVVDVPFNPPWTILGDRVFSLFEVHTAFPNPMSPAVWPRESAGPMTRVSEIFHRMTTVAAIEDSSRTQADYTGVWTRIGSWLPWMLQGQAPGHLFYSTTMSRLAAVDQLPTALRVRAEQRHSEFFRAPGDETWGEPNDSTFSVYMAEHEPRD